MKDSCIQIDARKQPFFEACCLDQVLPAVALSMIIIGSAGFFNSTPMCMLHQLSFNEHLISGGFHDDFIAHLISQKEKGCYTQYKIGAVCIRWLGSSGISRTN